MAKRIRRHPITGNGFSGMFHRFAWNNRDITDRLASIRARARITDRLDGLLWTWPIRRALTPQLPEKGQAVRALFKKVPELYKTLALRYWYPGPWQSDAEEQLRDLGLVAEGQPAGNLAKLLEEGWGLGEHEFRKAEQGRVLRGHPLTRRQLLTLCSIAERARDSAYIYSSTLSWQEEERIELDLLRDCIRDLPAAVRVIIQSRRFLLPKNNQDFAEFYAASDCLKKSQTQILARLRQREWAMALSEDAMRLQKRGKPPRAAWMNPARQALRALRFSRQERDTLLWAWGLVNRKNVTDS